MGNLRNAFLTWAVFCAAACLAQPLYAAPADAARDYPSKPVRFIVPFVAGASPEQFSAHIKSEIAKWRKLAQDANLALQ